MKYFLVDNKCYDDRRGEFTLKFTMQRKPAIFRRDSVLLFDKYFRDIQFVEYGEVDDVYYEETDILTDDIRIIRYKLKSQTKLEKKTKLSDLAYSLEKVYRYSDPLAHFRRNYINVSELDFHAIMNNEIYWARTLFGSFMNALPGIVISQFYKILIDKKIQFQVERNYFKLWNLLKVFIESNYIAAYQLLQNISDLSEQILDGNHKFDSLYIEENENFQHLSTQTKLLSAFSSSWKSVVEAEVELELEDELKRNRALSRFDKYPWPVEIIQ